MKNITKYESTKRLSSFAVNHWKTIRECFKQATFNKEGFVIVVDESNKVLGIVTDGDFRRAIWKDIPLDDSIQLITNKDFVFFTEPYTFDDIKNIFLTTNIMQIPILREGFLVDVIFRDDFYENKLNLVKPRLQIPVVI